MRHMMVRPAALVIVLCSCVLFAEQTATTADGKTVLLKDNGTWQYVNKATAVQETTAASGQGSLFEVIKNRADFDFRTVKWGMSKKEVLAAEKAKLVRNNPGDLEYETLLFGYQCVVVYNFTADKLTRALLHMRQEHIDPELFYLDYENLKKQLEPVFGEYLDNKCDWINDMYRRDTSKWGFAVSLGFLSCRTQWKTVRTLIALSIAGSNHQITTTMEYTSLVK